MIRSFRPIGQGSHSVLRASTTQRVVLVVAAMLASGWGTALQAGFSGDWGNFSGMGNPDLSTQTSIAAGDAAIIVRTRSRLNTNGGQMETLFNDPLGGPPADYSDPTVVGRAALRWRFEYGPDAGQPNACGGTATWRIRFGIPASEARSLWNPILHLDRLGGNQGSNFDTAVMAFPQPITKLAGQAKFEQMSATEVRRQVPWVVVLPYIGRMSGRRPQLVHVLWLRAR